MSASASQPAQRLHILVLTDRDWTHPQGGGTGTNLFGQIARWVAWGHRMTVIAGDYEGATKVEELGPLLTIHRMGGRKSVFPRAAWAVRRRGIGADADVVLEVINGIAFFTPIWLRKPRVALVHHVHRRMYVQELPARRGLGDRTRLLGFVDEHEKPVLYGRAWVALTASSAEGWCLTVTEAAACGTPSAALRIGGLPESIVDGETGMLADDVPELTDKVRELVERPELRERLGDAGAGRAGLP